MEPSRDGAGALPRISVIIPAFNAQSFIEASVRSALDQTQPPHEVIVVDDGSTDDTLGRLRSFGPSITVLTQVNGGAGIARNLGARAATGDWLAFLDADDVWRPNKLAVQTRSIDRDIALIYSDRFNSGDRGAFPERAGLHLDMTAGETLMGLLQDNVITTSSVLIRRSVFVELGGFSGDRAVLPAEDWDLWLRVIARYRVRLCPESLLEYRMHTASLSRRNLRMNDARITVVRRALDAPGFRHLNRSQRNRVLSACWLHNGADAYRAGARWLAARYCLRAGVIRPAQWAAWRDLIKVALRRL